VRLRSLCFVKEVKTFQPISRVAAQLALGLVLLCWCPLAGLSHPDLRNAMWAQFEGHAVRVAVNVSLKELAVAQGLVLREDAPADPALIAGAASAHEAYLVSHLKLISEGKELAGRVLHRTFPTEVGDPESTTVQYELEFSYLGNPPVAVTFLHTMLEEWPYGEGVPWNLSYLLRTKRADSPESASWLLRSHVPSTIETGPAAPSVAGGGGDDQGGNSRVKLWGVCAVGLGLAGVWMWRVSRGG